MPICAEAETEAKKWDDSLVKHLTQGLLGRNYLATHHGYQFSICLDQTLDSIGESSVGWVEVMREGAGDVLPNELAPTI